jgi:hypothetical protein
MSMGNGWWVFISLLAGCVGYWIQHNLAHVWAKRRPPKDTAELLNRIAPVAHSLIEARLTVAWHEAELAKIIDDVPPIFEDQVMLSAQLGQAIEQSVMRSVQQHGIPIVRLSGARAMDYGGWISKWLRRPTDEIPAIPTIVVPGDPQLPEHGSPSVPPPASVQAPTRPRTIIPPPRSYGEPDMIFQDGVWVPR